MKSLYIIKIGGNVIDDSAQLEEFLKNFAKIPFPKILVHGGGKLATQLAETLGVKQTIIDGRRVTDSETLKIVTMVYAGWINQSIVAGLQSLQTNAVGCSGADLNLVKSRKREVNEIDFGLVGDLVLESINTSQFEKFLSEGVVPVLNSITHDGNGNLLNTNADTLATFVAIALKQKYNVKLFYCFEKKGVLEKVNLEESYISTLTRSNYNHLKNTGVISKGMIPKLDNGFFAMESGIKEILICNTSAIASTADNMQGTQLQL